jgi:hypothetical protein
MATNIKQYRVKFSDQTGPNRAQLPRHSAGDRVVNIPVHAETLFHPTSDFSYRNAQWTSRQYEAADKRATIKPILKSDTYCISGIIPLNKDELRKNKYKVIDIGIGSRGPEQRQSVEIPIIREPTARLGHCVTIPVHYETSRFT